MSAQTEQATAERSAQGAEFKVGDRVRIVGLGNFEPSEMQGLTVGNTGAVVTVLAENTIGIRTDGPADDGDALSWGGKGWFFQPGDLELVAGDAKSVRADVARVVEAGSNLLRCLRSQGITDEEMDAAIERYDAALRPFTGEQA